jgi:hypothetical protein
MHVYNKSKELNEAALVEITTLNVSENTEENQ